MSDDPVLPPGYTLRSFDSLDSTNAEALRRIAEGSAGGDVIWARQQTAGRGRRGRLWRSPPGNLYVTFVVSVPQDLMVGQLAFVAAVGAGDAVKDICPSPERIRYKWPNDLMLDGRKLGGILIESGGEGLAQVVAVGLGLNVTSGPADLNAVSLRETGAEISVPELLGLVCRFFDGWYRIWQRDGFAPVRKSWLAAAHRMGDAIEVRFPDSTIVGGRFGGIDRNGALVLELPEGRTESIATGEVFVSPA